MLPSQIAVFLNNSHLIGFHGDGDQELWYLGYTAQCDPVPLKQKGNTMNA